MTHSTETLSTWEARREHYRRAGWWPGEPLVRRYAQVVADRPAALAVADSRGRELSHRQLWDAAAALAQDLAAHGVEPRAVVLLMMPNRVEWQIAFLAVLRLGAVPASAAVTTDPSTLGYMCDLAGVDVVVMPRYHQGRPHADPMMSALREATTVRQALVFEDDGSPQWTALPARSRRVDVVAEPVEHLLFTSSTTGPAKAVMHSHDTLAAMHQGFAGRFDLGPRDSIFMASPLGHSTGTIHGARLSMYLGAALVLQETWEPEQAVRLISEYRCTFTAAATPFLDDLVDLGSRGGQQGLASMRAFLCGGAPVPASLLDEARRQCPDTFVTVLWGMTEGGVTTCVPGDSTERLLATAGVGLPGLELRCLPVEGQDESMATGAGELAMRGPGVFHGYYRDERLYRSQLTRDGFFRTGDLASLDVDEYLHLTGRIKDIIIRGGVNISPAPIENCLAGHPGVSRVAVIGTPDDRLGERICAVVQPSGTPPTLDDLLAWAGAHGLPKRQWPERLHLVESMPLTPTGKVVKRFLRDAIQL